MNNDRHYPIRINTVYQKHKQMKTIIIANRLPVKIERDGNEFNIIRSEGGLATGLGSLETDSEIYWVGWPGVFTDDEKEKKEITKKLHSMNFHPVFYLQIRLKTIMKVIAIALYGLCVTISFHL